MTTQTKQQIRHTLKVWQMNTEFTGGNRWRVGSGEKLYKVNVYFQGYADETYVDGELVSQTAHGFHLVYECSCEASRFGKTCVHGQSVLKQYENDFSFLFPLFGLSVPAPVRFSELHKRAQEVDAKLKANKFIKAA
jgi:hypothetical protein